LFSVNPVDLVISAAIFHQGSTFFNTSTMVVFGSHSGDDQLLTKNL